MSRIAVVPRELSFVPFRGTDVIGRGLLTKGQLRGRAWHRLLPDVYVHNDAYDPDDHRMWCDAVALSLRPGDAIDGLSAAFLAGVDLLSKRTLVSVSVPTTAKPWPHPRITVTRTLLAPGDVTTFCGIRLTTPLRTAFDLGRRLPRVSGLITLDALSHRKLITVPALTALADQRCSWPGVRGLRELLTLTEPLAESPMETRLRLLLRDAGFPSLTAQHKICDDHGRHFARVDLAYPQWRIAIEYDGDHHRGTEQFRRDVTRLNNLRAAGWLVLRFTADDVLRHPGSVITHITQALRERQSRAEW